jgi:E1A/CREB-binding protein
MVYCGQIQVDVPVETKDKDEIMESEFFDTRQAFLSLCQGNHYQYDTLRRAKHSSMMVLYHLHNPTAPAFVVSCNMCHTDIDAGNGWRCETCADFDLCNNCKDLAKHPHKLTPFADRNAQNKEARQQRVVQVLTPLTTMAHTFVLTQCLLSCVFDVEFFLQSEQILIFCHQVQWILLVHNRVENW